MVVVVGWLNWALLPTRRRQQRAGPAWAADRRTCDVKRQRPTGRPAPSGGQNQGGGGLAWTPETSCGMPCRSRCCERGTCRWMQLDGALEPNGLQLRMAGWWLIGRRDIVILSLSHVAMYVCLV